MPGASAHPQPCVQSKKARKQVTTGSPKHPGTPCAMVLTASFALSPVIGLSCHRPRRDAKHHRQVDASVEASGPHDLAVRLTRVRLCAPKASTASPPNVRDDRETPLLIGHGMAGILPVIWEGDQSRDLRRIGTTGKSGVRAEIVSSEEQLLGHHPTPVSSPPCAQLRTGAGTHSHNSVSLNKVSACSA